MRRRRDESVCSLSNVPRQPKKGPIQHFLIVSRSFCFDPSKRLFSRVGRGKVLLLTRGFPYFCQAIPACVDQPPPIQGKWALGRTLLGQAIGGFVTHRYYPELCREMLRDYRWFPGQSAFSCRRQDIPYSPSPGKISVRDQRDS